MRTEKRSTRQSISLPHRIANMVKRLARSERTSATRAIVKLIETGLDAKAAERQRFLALVERLQSSTSPSEQKRLKKELAVLIFGE